MLGTLWQGWSFTAVVLGFIPIGGWVFWRIDRWQRDLDRRRARWARDWLEPAAGRPHQFGPADVLTTRPVAPWEYDGYR